MHRAKKMALVFTSLVLLIASLCPAASAIELSPRASYYLSGYGACLYEGTSRGSVRVEFTVSANEEADRVGVSNLSVYKADGTFVASVKGSLVNGLLEDGVKTHIGGYTFYGEPNTVYYMELTMYAEFNGGSDSRLYTTNSCRAPS